MNACILQMGNFKLSHILLCFVLFLYDTSNSTKDVHMRSQVLVLSWNMLLSVLLEILQNCFYWLRNHLSVLHSSNFAWKPTLASLHTHTHTHTHARAHTGIICQSGPCFSSPSFPNLPFWILTFKYNDYSKDAKLPQDHVVGPRFKPL